MLGGLGAGVRGDHLHLAVPRVRADVGVRRSVGIDLLLDGLKIGDGVDRLELDAGVVGLGDDVALGVVAAEGGLGLAVLVVRVGGQPGAPKPKTTTAPTGSAKVLTLFLMR